MAVLYRKYRPQVFSQVLGQKPIIQTLKNQVLGGSLAHAYLFTGSRGVGKTSVARILAKAVNCREFKEDACGVCYVCKQIEQGSFIDLVEIDAASNTGVDNIRELIEHVKFSPSSGKYKVFIIDEVHMLSKGAFNALLKTLEEPPKHAIFILATTEINKVPATIISRTQRFDFKAYSEADLTELLEGIAKQENIALGKDVLELVAQNAEGSARDALSLLGKVMTLGSDPSLEDCRQLLGVTDLKVCEDLLEIISKGQASKLPDFFSELSEKGLDYFILNRDFLEYLRKVLIYKTTSGKVSSNLEGSRKEKLQELSDAFTSGDLIFTIRLFLKSYKDLSGSPNPEIPLLLSGIEAAAKKGAVVQQASPAAPKAEPSTAEVPAPKAVIENRRAEEYLGATLEEVEAVWPTVIAKIKEVNGPLASMLKNCRLNSVERGKIVLVVKFVFDKQRLENPKNLELITSAYKQVSGNSLGLMAQVTKAESQPIGSAAEVLSDALKVFGGELVE